MYSSKKKLMGYHWTKSIYNQNNIFLLLRKTMTMLCLQKVFMYLRIKKNTQFLDAMTDTQKLFCPAHLLIYWKILHSVTSNMHLLFNSLTVSRCQSLSLSLCPFPVFSSYVFSILFKIIVKKYVQISVTFVFVPSVQFPFYHNF